MAVHDRVGSTGVSLPEPSQQREPSSSKKDHGDIREVQVSRHGHVEEVADWDGQPVLEPSPQRNIRCVLSACRVRVEVLGSVLQRSKCVAISAAVCF